MNVLLGKYYANEKRKNYVIIPCVYSYTVIAEVKLKT